MREVRGDGGGGSEEVSSVSGAEVEAVAAGGGQSGGRAPSGLFPPHTISPARKNAAIRETLIQRAAHVKVRRSRRCVTCAHRKWRRTLR